MTGVITGDIVSSLKNTSPVLWIKSLRNSLSQFGCSPEHWQIYRGDSFQLEVKELASLFETGVRIKADMRFEADVNVRLGLGIGLKSYESEHILESNGEAFINSGRVLEQLKKETLLIKTPWPDLDEELNLYFELISLVMDEWTVASAEAIRLALSNKSLRQKEIADQLDISQGRVSERLNRAGLRHIQRVNERFRKLINQQSGQDGITA